MRFLTVIVLFLIFLFFNIAEVHADCIKQILVREVTYKSNPNIFQKVIRPYTQGEKKEIWISCDLFSTIKVGDELTEPGDPVDRIKLLGGDNGVLERKRYIILKK